jgi:carbon monoxide dehydrogenase subunit G
MPHVTVTRHIAAPPQAVWAVVTDLEHAPQRISAIKRLEILTPQRPIGLGTRFRETRVMFGREATEEMTITAWSPPRSYDVEAASCGAKYHSRLSVEAAPGGGSTLTMSFNATPVSFMARLFSPLSKFMMGACRKALEKDLDDIVRSFTAGAPGASGAAGAQPA